MEILCQHAKQASLICSKIRKKYERYKLTKEDWLQYKSSIYCNKCRVKLDWSRKVNPAHVPCRDHNSLQSRRLRQVLCVGTYFILVLMQMLAQVLFLILTRTSSLIVLQVVMVGLSIKIIK